MAASDGRQRRRPSKRQPSAGTPRGGRPTGRTPERYSPSAAHPNHNGTYRGPYENHGTQRGSSTSHGTSRSSLASSMSGHPRTSTSSTTRATKHGSSHTNPNRMATYSGSHPRDGQDVPRRVRGTSRGQSRDHGRGRGQRPAPRAYRQEHRHTSPRPSAPEIRREEYGPAGIASRSENSRRRRDQMLRRARRAGSSRPPFPFGPVIAVVAVLLVVSIGYLVATNVMGSASQGGSSAATSDPLASQKSQMVSCAITDSTKIFTSTYDWDNLSSDGGRLSYSQGGNVVSRTGIDVSEHNGSINWSKVAKDNIDFAYIRMGYRGTVEGNITRDKRYKKNFSGAREAGLDIGVYFFSQAINEDEAREEADWVIKQLGDYVPKYPIVFDMEPSTTGQDRVSNLTNDQMTSIAVAFCREIESKGYEAAVYGSRADLAHYNLSSLHKYGFWYAEYADQPTMALRYGIWQYSDDASVEGIDGDVDLDLDLTDALRQVQRDEKGDSGDSGSSSPSD